MIFPTRQTGNSGRDARTWSVLQLPAEKRLLIVEVAVAWEPLIPDREREKCAKYQALARELAGQYPAYKVSVHPLVIGALGAVGRWASEVDSMGLLNKKERRWLLSNCQTEALCGAVRIIKSVLAQA